MTKFRLWAVVALLLPMAALVGLAVPADAVVIRPLTLEHAEQVYGDVEMVGNGVLVCPTTEPAATECLGASRRDPAFPYNNNRFAMRYADVDDDPATWNSSRGQVTLPAGARVTYARLQWSGNHDGSTCAVGQAGSYPAGASASTPVRLTVGNGDTVEVDPGSYDRETGSIRYYTADAEVTDAFAGVAAGTPVPITVGNVFAPTGRGCIGGWSLVLVHTLDDAPCGTERREVFVYDGHVRQGQNDGPNTVTAGGFRVSGAPARLGVTAYEGDSGNVGAVLRVNGTAVADPSTGSTTNFFNSYADNELDPSYANNFSVDSKLLDVPAGLIPAGATSADIETQTTGDTYVLQSVVLSVPVPALCLEKSVSPATAVPGDTLTWTLQVSNPTTSDALDVAVSDPEVPACDRAVGTLAAGASTTYTCTSTATADLTNVATVTGTASGGNALSASAAASVDVVAPEVEVTTAVEPQIALPGDDVDLTIEVGNTGDTPLAAVTVDDDLVDACDRVLGALAVGEDATYTCTGTVGDDDFADVTTVTATPPAGPDVTASDGAAVDVVHPSLTVDVTASDDEVEPGTEVTFDVTVGNDGDVVLEDVAVDDPQAPGCTTTGLTLAPGTEETVTCTVTVEEDLENVATASGSVLDGDRDLGPFTASGSATVTVGDEAGPEPTDPGGTDPNPGGGGTPQGGVAPSSGDVLPDTGAPADALPLTLLGLVLLGAGAWLSRRRRG